jgi:outer membrane protein
MQSPSRWFLLLFVFLGVASAGAAPEEEPASEEAEELRVATVDIQKLFADYHQTRSSEQKINNERARIAKASQRIGDEIRQRRKVLQKRASLMKSETVPAEKKAQFKREKPVLEREISLLERKQEKERNAATARLNRQMEARMNGILEEITRRAAQYAKEQGYHLLYDSSGTNSVQVPPILASAHAVDITSELAKSFAKAAREPKKSD